MGTNKIFIVYTKTSKQANALRALLEALDIKFEIAGKQDQYDPVFVEKINKSREACKRGKFKTVDKRELQSFLGLK